MQKKRNVDGPLPLPFYIMRNFIHKIIWNASVSFLCIISMMNMCLLNFEAVLFLLLLLVDC